MLVLIGATPEGKKELLGFQVGVRESGQSWRELLVDLKARSLAIAAELATGEGHSASGRHSKRCRRPPGTSAVPCTRPPTSTEMSLHVLAYHIKRVIAIIGVGPLLQAIRA
jgi:Transposase, Mutator family